MGCGSSKVHGAAAPPFVAAPAAEAAPVLSLLTGGAANSGPTLDKAARATSAGSQVLRPPAAGCLEKEPASPAARIARAPSAPTLGGGAASPLALSPNGPRASAAAGRGRGLWLGRVPARRGRPTRTLPADGFTGCLSNGFRATPEVHSLECAAERIAPFTLPAEALTFEPPPEAVVARFRNGDQERKIHLNVRLSEHEQEMLAQMRQEAKTTGAEFYPSVAAMATRFLSRARGDAKRAVKLMRATQRWRSAYFQDGPVSDASVLEDMRHGIVYFSGRDKALRPTIVVRARRIPQEWYAEKRIDKFIRVLIFCMEYFTRYMVVPGRVENLNVIVDMQGLGISQVPVSALAEVYGVLSHHYIGRVYRFYACNVSFMLNALAGAVKGLLTDRQKQKLCMVTDVTELHQDFALHQLEEDLGGSRPVAAQFFPFPLPPGPFGAGDANGPAAKAVPDAHDVLSASGALGRSWDPKLTSEANRQLEYGPRAVEILEACGLPVPQEARRDRHNPCMSFAFRSMESRLSAPEAASAPELGRLAAEAAGGAGGASAAAEAGLGAGAEAWCECGAVEAIASASTSASSRWQEDPSPKVHECHPEDDACEVDATRGRSGLFDLLSFRACCAA